MPLTAKSVKEARPNQKDGKPADRKVSDEKGLFLLVKANGSKYWRLAYRFGGKQKTLALGVYPEVSLKDARDMRDEARLQLRNDIDPSDTRRIKKITKGLAQENSFEAVAREWFATRMQDKSKSHQDRTLRALEKDFFPYLGKRPIAEITAPELLSILRKIEQRGANETAHRARQTAGQIFRYAIATARAERDPAADLRDALSPAVEKHFPAITDPKELGKLLIAIDGYQGQGFTVKAALQLTPMLLVRPGELRHMEWNEVNWSEQRWEIPAEKMKLRQPHIVPLCNQALEILSEQHRFSGKGRYAFPSPKGASRPMSENGVRTALRTLGYDNDTVTPHGFRATARTLLVEELDYRIEWVEQQLSHAVKDANGRAYNRTTYIKQRTGMMQAWADYLDNLKV